MWLALLTDLQQGVPSSAIAARFHAGLADAVAGLARSLTLLHGVDTVALSGGVLQNKTLFEAVVRGLTTSACRYSAIRRCRRMMAVCHSVRR